MDAHVPYSQRKPPGRMAGEIRWWGRQLGLAGLSILLLTGAFAPVSQFYLAWFGLVPWLMALRECRSIRSAFLLSWIAGTVFFTANMWWMGFISVPGWLALMIYCGTYWAAAGLLVHRMKLFEPGGRSALVSIFLFAAIWTTLEWFRSYVITGLPWLYLGHTQTPLLAMCQIADTLGAYGVSFAVAAVNAAVFMALIVRPMRRIAPAAIVVGSMVVLFVVYGVFRIEQTATEPGPLVVVVQANEPQSNTGLKGASDRDRIDFHITSTKNALAAMPLGSVDLVAWSETMIPPINQATLDAMVPFRGRSTVADDRFYARQEIANLAAAQHVGILTGSLYAGQWTQTDLGTESLERRNTALFFHRDGSMLDGVGQRYDKIHLVPFGEFVPFRQSAPWLYDLLLNMGPPDMKDYELADGSDNGPTVFQLSQPEAGKPPWRFVTPICFEDLDSRLVARMMRPAPGETDKRADFLVNITNDGWFKANENSQHLQAAIFRSIENRVPTARSVNTGISGFVDSVGHVSGALTPRTGGTSAARLMLDGRVTFYTRHGDLFAAVCTVIATAETARAAAGAWRRRRRDRGRSGKSSESS